MEKGCKWSAEEIKDMHVDKFDNKQARHVLHPARETERSRNYDQEVQKPLNQHKYLLHGFPFQI